MGRSGIKFIQVMFEMSNFRLGAIEWMYVKEWGIEVVPSGVINIWIVFKAINKIG